MAKIIPQKIINNCGACKSYTVSRGKGYCTAEQSQLPDENIIPDWCPLEDYKPDENKFDSLMEAKKSGWDDCIKYYKISDKGWQDKPGSVGTLWLFNGKKKCYGKWFDATLLCIPVNEYGFWEIARLLGESWEQSVSGGLVANYQCYEDLDGKWHPAIVPDLPEPKESK